MRLEFSPDHFVDDTGIGLDQLYDLCGDALVGVVGHGESVVAVAYHGYGCVDGLQQGVCVDAGEDEVAFVKGFGTLGGGADAHGGERMAHGEEER